VPTHLVQPRSNLTASNARGLSPSIWGDFPIEEINAYPGRGFFHYDDFTKPVVIVTPTITTQAAYGGGYKAFGSAGGTIIQNTSRDGELEFTETDDDQAVSLAWIGLPFKIDRGQGHFCMEARLKTNTATDARHNIFLGLLESSTLAVGVPLADDDLLSDNNYVGFKRHGADGDQIDTIYRANGVGSTYVTVKADALSTALAADTYIKLGLKYNPDTYVLSWWVNGLKLADTKTIPEADGTDFPNDVAMGPVLAVRCVSADDAVVTLDEWAFGQVYTG